MMWKLALVLGVTICAGLGFTFRDRQYRLQSPHMESDQAVLAHSDSAYTSMTWVASASGNYCQLRFFDKVEGGICLRPTWQELIDLHDPRLAHLVPESRPQMLPPAATWPYSWIPDPGTVSNSPYVRLFPLTMLLNNRLIAAAHDDTHAISARVLVVGLGSGAGIAVLAHHFPGLAITVVDIDHKVVDIVCGHFPLIKWLSQQPRPDGEPRLQFHVGDARQFVHAQGEHGAPLYDAIILDAYTAGSTIPPHLMTVEFFRDCARILEPHGVVLANIIGSYGRTVGQDAAAEIVGEKHRVLGGAIRSFRAAGLTHVMNFPVLGQWDKAGDARTWDETRNNIVVSSREAIEPGASEDPRWSRVASFVLYPEVPTGRYLVRRYLLGRSDDLHWGTAMVDASIIDQAQPTLAGSLTASPTLMPSVLVHEGSNQTQIQQARDAVKSWSTATRGGQLPTSWDETADKLYLLETDSVGNARDTYQATVNAARDKQTHSGQMLVGDLEDTDPHHASEHARIWDAPLFTDQRPNADILNR